MYLYTDLYIIMSSYQHKSGAEKRTEKKRAQQAHVSVVSKTPKLTTYFASGSSSSFSVDSTMSHREHVMHTDSGDNSDEAEESQHNSGLASDRSESEVEHAIDSSAPELEVTREYPPDIGLWPDAVDQAMREYWAEKGPESVQNKTSNFVASKVVDGDRQVRYCSQNYFLCTHELTNTNFNRSWLCYAPSNGKVYCFYCKLFSTQKTTFGSDGFNDWKNGTVCIRAHERSVSHLFAIQKATNLKTDEARVDVNAVKQYNAERKYFQSVLERVIEVIKFLAERGLAFRGHDEKLGSAHNGNFLGLLELISKFDPFLAAHIERQRSLHQQHRRSVSYLSSTICNELINLMGQKVMNTIVDQVKGAKYYSISIDSTPDACKIDRCTCIVRYLPQDSCIPVERFLKFMDMSAHTAAAICNSLMTFLDEVGIDIHNCRGQSYDNASNMSGKYQGVQALVKQLNSRADYIPCFGHSLNLAGVEAASCIPEATAFFDVIQKMYTFLSASTHRWAVLVSHLDGTPVVKSLSQTRWSARADATKALRLGYSEIKTALVRISQDTADRPETRQEADGLVRKMEQLEFGILTECWAVIMDRFYRTSTALQSADLDLNVAVDLIKSLIDYVTGLREEFDVFEQRGRLLAVNSDYKEQSGRRRFRSTAITQYEGRAEETNMSPRDKFRVNVFLRIIDTISAALQKRLAAYSVVCAKFGFLHNLTDVSDAELRTASDSLVRAYPTDLEPCLAEEMVQFKSFLKVSTEHGTFPATNNLAKYSAEVKYYSIASSSGIRETFPNVNVAFRIYLSLMVTNCSGERSFSALGRVKNELRTTMSDERLNFLSLMTIESDLLREIDFRSVIDDFSKAKARQISL